MNESVNYEGLSRYRHYFMPHNTLRSINNFKQIEDEQIFKFYKWAF